MTRRSRDYGVENNRNLHLVIGFARGNSGLQGSIQRLLVRFDITLPQFSVLEALYHLGNLKICEIVEKTLSTNGNMTVVIRNLEKKSFVLREQSQKDKRVSLISLTEKGRDLIEIVFLEHLEILSKHLRHLSDDEKDELSRLIKKMNGVL